MFKVARELFQAREIREALRAYWVEALLWPAVAGVAAFAALYYGLAPGLGVVGLAALVRLRPRVTRLTSPDGRRVLTDRRWSFGRVIFLAVLVAVVATMRLVWLPSVPALAAVVALFSAFAVAILIMTFAIPLLMSTWFPWSLHLVLVREGGRLKTWYVRLRVSYYAETEYLWLPDGRSLLVAQSDEDDCWYLYLYDPDAEEPGARYPYHMIVGHYPHLQRVTLGEARARVAPYLRESSAPAPPATTVEAAEAALSEAQPGAAPAGAAASAAPAALNNYEALCRRFFVWFNPQCVNN